MNLHGLKRFGRARAGLNWIAAFMLAKKYKSLCVFFMESW
jgi:hypothetical protein